MKKFTYLLMMVLMVVLAFAESIRADPYAGLVAYYPFNGNANDASGNGHNGAIYGPVLTQGYGGQQNSAYAFDGANDYIEIPDNSQLSLTEALTVSAWIWLDNSWPPPAHGGAGDIVCKHYDKDGHGYSLRVTKDCRLRGVLEGQGFNSQSVVSRGKWTHVALTFDKQATKAKLYIDGQQDLQELSISSLNPSGKGLRIGDQSGYSGSTNSEVFQGKIDEVRIHNRALSHSEISALKEQVTLTRFEINQCFQDVDEMDGTTPKYDLIETKPFVARVTLVNVSSVSKPALVKLSVFNLSSGKQIGTTKVMDTTLCSTSKPIDFLFIDGDTKDIKAGMYKFSLVVGDYVGNIFLRRDLTYEFKSSKTVRMLVVPTLRYGVLYTDWDDRYLQLVEQVFPVPKRDAIGVNRLERVRLLLPIIFVTEIDLRVQMLIALAEHASADFICAVVPPGCKPGGEWLHTVLIKESSYTDEILAHEVGHVYGLGEEYVNTGDPGDKRGGSWILRQFFKFDRNPPPLELADDGEFIIPFPWSGEPITKRYNWVEGEDHVSYPEPHDYNNAGKITGKWCAGRYIGEGGYDQSGLFGRKEGPVGSSTTYSIMSLAGQTDSYWISGPEYGWLIKELVGDKRTTGTKLFDIHASASSQEQNRMIISGFVNITNRTAELRPLIPVPNIELTPEVPDSNCQLVFMSQLGATLGSFNFAPLQGEEPNSHLEGPFCLIVDLPEDTTNIQLITDGVIADELRLTDNSPTVSVLSPNGGEEIAGELLISWSASDPDGDELKHTIEFSNDNGTEWGILAIDYNESEFVIDSNHLPGGNNCLVKVTASDGWNRSEDVSDAPFSIPAKAPKVTILDPLDSGVLLYSESMQGRCSAYDPETGDINDPNKIVWSSDVDGFLGKGVLTEFHLSLGNHTLSVTATDPEGRNSTGTVNVTVVANRSDFNKDLIVDLNDLAEFTSFWLESCSEPNWCNGRDLNSSGRVNYIDFTIFSDNWMFKFRPPDMASNPYPSNMSVNVSTNVVLNWTSGALATSHDIYFGVRTLAFKGNQKETAFVPGTLSSAWTYYWRVDEVNPAGKTTGTVWSFRTGSNSN